MRGLNRKNAEQPAEVAAYAQEHEVPLMPTNRILAYDNEEGRSH
jgi:hypothetical protein